MSTAPFGTGVAPFDRMPREDTEHLKRLRALCEQAKRLQNVAKGLCGDLEERIHPEKDQPAERKDRPTDAFPVIVRR